MISMRSTRGAEGRATFGKRLAERFGLIGIKESVLERRVPETPWYLGDGAALALLLAVQVITGIVLTLYYTDSADYAYESVRFITHQLPLGRLVRGMHYWSAGVMVATLFVHVSRHLLLGGYKAPREGTWTIGVFLFFLVLTMSLTGYVLRWDVDAIFAVRIVLNGLHAVPIIGDELVILLQGGPHPGSLTLTRFYSLHIWIVAFLLFGLVGWHLYLVVIHGVTHRAEWDRNIRSAREHREIYKLAADSLNRGQWFHPDTVFVSGTIAFAVFCIPFALAIVVGPPELFSEANLVDHSMPREEWWFSWFSSLAALLPPLLAPIFYVAGPLLAFVAMLLLPLIDRGPNRGIRKRPYWAAFVILSVIGLLWLSDLRLRSPWTGWPDANPPPVPAAVVLTEKAEAGRGLFARYGCNSCHAIASHGREVGPDLAGIEHRLSPSELRQYILKPPEDIPMPGYQGRIPEADLDRIVEFVLVAQTFPREY